jgi:hypothetical protein
MLRLVKIVDAPDSAPPGTGRVVFSGILVRVGIPPAPLPEMEPQSLLISILHFFHFDARENRKSSSQVGMESAE